MLGDFYSKEYAKRREEKLGQTFGEKLGASEGESKYSSIKIEKTTEMSGPSVKKSGIEQEIIKIGLTDWVEVSGENNCLRIKTILPILFSSGSAVVAQEYKTFLKKLALFLKPYDIKVVVSGYADTDPIKTKQYPSNFELGAARATNIVHELVKNGLKPSVFQVETTGEYRFSAQQPSSRKSFHRRAQVEVIFTG